MSSKGVVPSACRDLADVNLAVANLAVASLLAAKPVAGESGRADLIGRGVAGGIGIPARDGASRGAVIEGVAVREIAVREIAVRGIAVRGIAIRELAIKRLAASGPSGKNLAGRRAMPSALCRTPTTIMRSSRRPTRFWN